MEIEAVRVEIALLELRPGDVLVAKLPVRYGDEAMSYAAETLQRIAPDGVRVLMLPHDVDLSVLTRAEIDQRASEPKFPARALRQDWDATRT